MHLTNAAYTELGGVEGAIAARANALLEKLDETEQGTARLWEEQAREGRNWRQRRNVMAAATAISLRFAGVATWQWGEARDAAATAVEAQERAEASADRARDEQARAEAETKRAEDAVVALEQESARKSTALAQVSDEKDRANRNLWRR